MNIDLRAIQHALALAQTRNFARAADLVHITQPSLSRSIATLERALCVRLFDRLPTGVEPTAFGRLLIERGTQLVGDAALLKREIDLLAGLQIGNLTIGKGPYVGESMVGRAAAKMIAKHPGLTTVVCSMGPHEVVAGVLDGEIDVGVGSEVRVRTEPKLLSEKLSGRRIHFVCRADHPLTRDRRIAREEILRFPIVSAAMAGEVAEFARTSGARGRYDEDSGEFAPTIQVDSTGLARAIVDASDAIFAATFVMVQDEIALGRLIRLDVAWEPMPTRPCMFYRRGRTPSPAARLFMESLRATDAEATEAEQKWVEQTVRGPTRRNRSPAKVATPTSTTSA